ncbi:transcription termination/antitermination protein NusA [bacterium]|nr:MAG: transcription termination/antitermination protein NusA [bacterium]
MLDIKQFLMAVEQLAAEKNIPKDKVLETVEFAIAAAYKKENSLHGCKIKAKLDQETSKTKIWQELTVVSEESLEEEEKKLNPKKQILIEDAQKKKKSAKVGDIIKLPLKTLDDYGRIATQTAKQVIIQKIKEIEQDLTIEEYKTKEGETISGIIQREERGVVYLDIGRSNGILPPQEQIPNEHYSVGQRLKVLLLNIKEEARGPIVFLSRNRAEFITKLLELEVPEIANGSVKIKSITREAGKRSKIAVASEEEGIDPIGACVGQRGTRISAVINELGGENIDIILWDKDSKKFISNALSPAKVLDVKINKKENKAEVLVAKDQLSLAIGKGGQNVRLAAKLTGWKIDIVGQEIKIAPAQKEEVINDTNKKSKKENRSKTNRSQAGKRTKTAKKER